MTFTLWLAYVAMAALNILSPGPAILLAISNRIRFGIQSVYFSSLGNAVGLFVLAGCATLGLGSIVKESVMLFTIVKIIGAAYLIYLGIKRWQSKTNIFKTNSETTESAAEIVGAMGRATFFRGGLALAVTNPKPLLFFAALYPQFLDFHAPVAPQFLIMTFTFMAISFASLLTYASLARRAVSCFSRDDHARYFNKGSGAAFVFLGVGMLFLKRPS